MVRDNGDALAGLDYTAHDGDVRDPASLRALFDGAELVFHMAARISITGSHGGLVEAINVDGARNAAEAALACGVRRFVHFSSIHAFDLSDPDRHVDETSPRATRRHPAYDQSKAAGEREVRRIVERGLDAVVLHPVGCIGPWDFGPSRMGQVFLDLYNRRLPAAVDGGFHWVDTRDVAAAAISAADKGTTGESYILSGRWCSVRELGTIAEKVTGVPGPRAAVPIWLASAGVPFVGMYNRLFGGEPLFTSESLHALKQSRMLSTRKAERELDFAPRPLEESVADVYRWFADAGHVSLGQSD